MDREAADELNAVDRKAIGSAPEAPEPLLHRRGSALRPLHRRDETVAGREGPSVGDHVCLAVEGEWPAVGLDAPLFPLKNPAILSVPVGFLAAITGTFLFGSRREEEMFDELYIRQNTGYGIADATDH